MSKLLQVAASDPSKEREGVWADFCPDGETTFRVKLRRNGGDNREFHAAMEKATRSFRRANIDFAQIPVTKQREITCDVYSSTIIADWKEEDFDLPYTVENAKAMLEGSTAFMEWCVAESGRLQSYRATAVGETEKN